MSDPAYSCFQDSQFGVEDPTRWKVDLSLQTRVPASANTYLAAIERWTGIIVGDLPSAAGASLASTPDICENDYPTLVDDIHICVRDVIFDGQGGVIGIGTPGWVRSGTGTAITCDIEFDSDDTGEPIFIDYILHEMGHCLGIGTLWEDTGDVTKRGGGPRAGYEYTGAHATNVWQNDWGCAGTPPIETDFGSGAAGGHWDECCLRNEVMSTFLFNEDDNPFSELTIGALDDLGYTVDYGQADDAADRSTYPCCETGSCLTNRRLRKMGDGRPPLSDAGRAAAEAYGRTKLDERRLPPGVPRERDGARYVGDRSVRVLYEEGGFVHEVALSP